MGAVETVNWALFRVRGKHERHKRRGVRRVDQRHPGDAMLLYTQDWGKIPFGSAQARREHRTA